MSASPRHTAPTGEDATGLAGGTLESALRQAGRLFLQAFRDLESKPVQPALTAEEVSARFAGSLGEQGRGAEAALEEFESSVLPASTAMSSPMYFGLLNCSPLPIAALGDLLVSALNNNAGAFHQGPAARAAEQEVVRAFGGLVDAGTSWQGMLLPGGTFANLQGLMLARQATPAPPGRRRLYVSESCHFSVQRSAAVLGFIAQEVVAVPARSRGALDAAWLRTRLVRDRESGAVPVAVVGTAGTTSTGAIDPIAELADLCAEAGLWLHVDACYGGAALLLEELRPRFAGLERADSLALDPHKWFFMPLTTSLLLFRRPGADLASFDLDVAYIPRGGGEADPWRCGLPTSRRASALTLWLALRSHGFGVIREAVRRGVALSRQLERELAKRGFEVLPEGELSIVCARWPLAGRDGSQGDALQERIASDVRASGRAWFATTHHAGRTWLCFRSTNLHTRERHVLRLAEMVEQTALRLAVQS